MFDDYDDPVVTTGEFIKEIPKGHEKTSKIRLVFLFVINLKIHILLFLRIVFELYVISHRRHIGVRSTF